MAPVTEDSERLVTEMDSFFGIAASERETITPVRLQEIFDDLVTYTHEEARQLLAEWHTNRLLFAAELKQAADLAHPQITRHFSAGVISGYTRNTLADGYGNTKFDRFNLPELAKHGDSLFVHEQMKHQ